MEVKLKLEFLRNIQDLKKQNEPDTLNGYLLLDFDLAGLDLRDDLPIHAALLSKDRIKIIELADDDKHCIDGVEKRLEDRIRAIKTYIGHVIPVTVVIVFPNKARVPPSAMSSDDDSISILYKDELVYLITPSKPCQISNEISTDTKIALAKMLQFGYLKVQHPDTEEEAVWQAVQRFCCQRHGSKIEVYTQITFNSIKLTEIQELIKNDLLNGSTLLWGGYGIGKTVAIVATIKELIKQYKNH